MTARAVKLKVFASVPKDCSFWLGEDGWNGVCEELSLTVRGSSFEDAKTIYSTQRMIGWNPIFQRHIAEHSRLLLLIVSTHACFLPQLSCGRGVGLQQPPKAIPSQRGECP